MNLPRDAVHCADGDYLCIDLFINQYMYILHNSWAICVHLLELTLYTCRGVACAADLLYNGIMLIQE